MSSLKHSESYGMRDLLKLKIKMKYILPLLFGAKYQTSDLEVVCPSKFNEAMEMSTTDRLNYMKKSHQRTNIVGSPFSATPNVVIFQNFDIRSKYTADVSIINLHESSQYLKVAFLHHPFFSISYVKDTIYTKLAPGMSYNVRINFYPEEMKEHRHRIIFENEDVCFVVPIIALPRTPIINFPDNIVLPDVAVKRMSTLTMTIVNRGCKDGNFTINVKPPFYAQPRRGMLTPSQSMDLTFSYRSFNLGPESGTIKINYDFGIVLTANIKCCSMEADVRIDKSVVRFEDTYMSLKQKAFINVINNAEHNVDVAWSMYRNRDEDLTKTENYELTLKDVRDYEKKRCADLQLYNIIDYERHCMVYDRIYEDEIESSVRNAHFFYRNEIFCIIPLLDTIPAKSSKTYIIIFAPHRNIYYESSVYLDVTGRKNRIPIKFTGIGKAPSIELNLKSLNINDIFIMSQHQYEVVAFNTGSIQATFTFVDKPLEFGGEIVCIPRSSVLPPLGCAVFILKFITSNQNRFVERIDFLVEESDQLISFVMRGNVICPLLKSTFHEIDLGDIPIGYPIKKNIILNNESLVDIEYQAEIPDDGIQTPLVLSSSMEHFDWNLPWLPKEITFSPISYTVPGFSTVLCNVHFTPNKVGEFYKEIVIKMWGSAKNHLVIPIRANVIAPVIFCNPSTINIRFCFVNYPYRRYIKLTNKSDAYGFINLHQETYKHDVNCELSLESKFISPDEEIEVTLDISTRLLGIRETNLILQVFGKKPLKICKIICNGQGPVITFSPSILNFGNIKLLETATEVLKFMNDSPVVADISLTLSPNSLLSVEPKQFNLYPGVPSEVIVYANLNNPGPYAESLSVNVTSGELMYVKIQATGVGTMILLEPYILPELNLGSVMTYIPYQLPIKFTNKGKMFHKLQWSRNKYLKRLRRPNDNPEFVDSVFQISPESFDLICNQSIDTELIALNSKSGYMEEEFYCHAMIGPSSKLQLIFELILKAKFVEPTAVFSKPELKLRTDIGIDATLYLLKDDIEIKNTTDLPLQFNLKINPPFYILCNEEKINEMFVKLDKDDSITVVVEFLADTSSKRCTVSQDYLKLDYIDHPKEDNVLVKGFINYPTLVIYPDKLNFGNISLLTQITRSIMLKNTSPLPLAFKWVVIRESMELEHSTGQSDHRLSIQQPSDYFIATSSNINVEDAESTQMHIEENNSESFKNENNEEVSNNIMSALFEDDQKARVQGVLYPIIDKYKLDEVDIQEIVYPSDFEHSYSATSIINMNITPMYGLLDPYECCVTSISVQLQEMVKFQQLIVCVVEGGQNETVSVCGMSSSFAYSLSETFVNFSRRLFGEETTKTISLSNRGMGPFNCNITGAKMTEYTEDEFQSHGWLKISPKQGLVEPGKVLDFNITYTAGVGEFSETIFIEIEHQEPIPINIQAYGAYNQIYLTLRRPEVYSEDVAANYTAIASVTMDDLKCLRGFKNLCSDQTKSYVSNINKVQRKHLMDEGYAIYSHSDVYPTVMDIELTIERCLLFTDVQNDLSRQQKSKGYNFWKYTLPAYDLDFGTVILDTTAYFTALLVNYGPSRVAVKTVAAQLFDKKGFQVYLSNSGYFGVGETVEIGVSFKPTLSMYPTRHVKVRTDFKLEVKKGCTVPVNVFAEVTVPIVKLEKYCFDFGPVYCGNCLKKSIIISNPGKVSSKFYAEITDDELGEVTHKNYFFLKNNENKIDPNRQCRLNIYFKPSSKGPCINKLLIHIELSTATVEVQLFGYGLIKSLAIEPTILNFTPCVPYSIGNEMTFKLQNVTTGFMEYCFQDLDGERYEEEMILKLYMQCNQLNEVYIPKRMPKSKLPRYFYDFYKKLLDELRKDAEKKKLKRAITSKKNIFSKKKHSTIISKPPIAESTVLLTGEESVVLSNKINTEGGTSRIYQTDSDDNVFVPSGKMKKPSQNSLSKKPTVEKLKIIAKSKQQVQEEESTNDMKVLSTEVNESIEHESSTTEQVDIMANKSFKEIEKLLKDFLSSNNFNKKCICSDYTSAFIEEEKAGRDDYRDKLQLGAVIVFHGAPSTYTIKASIEASRMLNIPNTYIDHLILKAVANEICPAAVFYKQIIETEYDSLFPDSSFDPWDDEYDILQKKVMAIISKKTVPKLDKDNKKKKSDKDKDSEPREDESTSPANTKESMKSKKSEAGDKNKKQKKTSIKEVKTIDIFLDVHPNIIMEILQEELKKYTVGVVIQNLDTVFINKPSIVLDCLLKAIGNRKYIHFIILTYDFAEYKLATAMKQMDEIKVDSEKREINLIQLANTEFENLTKEDKVAYKQLLTQRKLEAEKRQNDLKKRLDAQNQPKQTRKKTLSPKGSPENKQKMSAALKNDKKKEKDAKKKTENKTSSSSKNKTEKKSNQTKMSSSKGSKATKDKPKLEKISSEEKQVLAALQKWSSELLYLIHCLEFWERTKGFLVKPYVDVKEQQPILKAKTKASKMQSSSRSSRVSIAVGSYVEKLLSSMDLDKGDKLLDTLNIGIPCWIMNRGLTFKDVQTKILWQVQNSAELLEVVHEARITTEPKLNELDTYYSVIERPKYIKRVGCSPLFEICELDEDEITLESRLEEELSDTIEEIDDSTTVSLTSKYSKVSKESKTSKLSKLSKLSKASRPSSKTSKLSSISPKRSKIKTNRRCCGAGIDPNDMFSTRSTLEPGEIRHFKVHFKPKECGKFKLVYPLEIVDCHTKYDVICNGVSDIPQLCMIPSMLFPRVITDPKMYDTPISKVYRDDCFDFGYIPYYKPRHEVNIISSQIVPLKNISMVPCEVLFGEEGDTKGFIINTNHTIINTASTGEIEVSVITKSLGVQKVRLFISVIGNPRVYSLYFKYTCVKLDYSVTPKTILFEQVHLNQKHEKCIKLKNLCPCMLVWKFINYDWALHNYQFSSTYGNIAPNGKCDIKIQYLPTIVETLPKRPIGLQLSSEFKNTDVFSELVYLFAESVEMSIECEKSIDIGEVKGKTEYKIPYSILNKGKLNLQVSFYVVPEGVNAPENESIKNSFNIFPSSGVIIPGKPFTTNIYFFPQATGNYKNIEVFKVNITDTLHNDSLQMFSLRMSTKVYLSRFEICPRAEVSFGHQLTNSIKTQDVTLQNTGKFWFSYVILDLKTVVGQKNKKDQKKGQKESSSHSESKSMKSTKMEKSFKGAEKGGHKEKTPKLNIGCFAIVPSSGRVEPGQTATIQVQALPHEVKYYKESMVIFISECNDADRKGKQIDLVTECCEPILDFDHNIMFKEHYRVAQIKDFTVNNNIGTYNVYAYAEKHLFMKNVCIYSTHKASVYCQNKGMVVATVTAKVTKDEQQAFSIYPEKIEDVLTFARFEITFVPPTMDICSATIEINYNNLHNGKFTFTVYGHVCIPDIKLLHPVAEDGKAVFTYPIVPLGETSSMNIKFQNVGKLPIKVVVDVRDDKDNLFILRPRPEIVPYLNIWDEDVAKWMKHTNLVNMSLNYIADFDLVFIPQTEVTTKVKVLIHFFNNPFDFITIVAYAQSHTCSLITHDLSAYILKPPNDDRHLLTYRFDVGSIPINKMKIKKFNILNITEDNILKFEFPASKEFKIAPRVGHLRPKCKKEILLGYFSRVPLKIDKFLMECELTIIEYDKPETTEISWDDRQNFSIAVLEEEKPKDLPVAVTASKSSKNVITRPVSQASALKIEESPPEEELVEPPKEEEELQPCIASEPPYNAISVLHPVLFEICLSVDYATYTCSTRVIHLPDTYIMEESVETFTVKNTSPLPIKIVWDHCVQAVQLTGSEDNLSDISEEIKMFDYDLNNDKRNVRYELVISPFHILPKKVKIHPQFEQEFTIKFMPTDNQKYYGTLSADILHLHPEYTPLNIVVHARSYRPQYYFQYEGKRTCDSHEICSTQTVYKKRLVEFFSVGLSTVKRVINIVNCSDDILNFTWADLEEPNQKVLCFRCHNYTGVALPNQKTEVVFTFIPPSLGTFKKFLYFSVNNSEKKEIFFLKGVARNPVVYFHKPSIQFDDTVIGLILKEEVLLTNEEDEEITFKVKRQSLFASLSDPAPIIKVDPMCGILGPKSKQNFTFGFYPEKVGVYNFATQVIVEKMISPLIMNISGRCYDINVSVYYVEKPEKHVLMKPNKINYVQFGNMVTNTLMEKQFKIQNNGDTKILYSWSDKLQSTNELSISFSHPEGCLEIDGEDFNTVGILPIEKCQISKVKLLLQVHFGPAYHFCIQATTDKPEYKFSFTSYDFGFALQQTSKSTFYAAELKVLNTGIHTLNLEKREFLTDHFSMPFHMGVIAPKKCQILKIYFHPLTLGNHTSVLTLAANGQKVEINLSGCGVAMYLEPLNPIDNYIHLGTTEIGKHKTKAIRIINKSTVEINVLFDTWDRLPINCRPPEKVPEEMVIPKPTKKVEEKKKGKAGSADKLEKKTTPTKKDSRDKKSKKGEGSEQPTPKQLSPGESMHDRQERLLKKYFVVTPKKPIKLMPKQTSEFYVTFTPKEYVEPFSENIFCEVQNRTELFCMVKGSCKAHQYTLSKTILPFGNVIIGSSRAINVTLHNSGQLIGKYKWNFLAKENAFTISPDSGFVLAGSEILFTVTFAPKTVHCNIRSTVKCNIDGYSRALEIKLLGESREMPHPKDTLKFNCPVREEVIKSVTLNNSTSTRWEVCPVIYGHYFRANNFILNGNSSESCDITFAPLKMCTRDKPHKALILFPMPEGQGVVYSLEGIAEDPFPTGKINREIPCKTFHNEVLPVKLMEDQDKNLSVTTKLLSDVTTKTLYKVSGNKMITIIAYTTRMYNWGIYIVNEGVYDFRVIFKNEVSKEYQFYDIHITATASGPLEEIDLITCVRIPIKKIIKLENLVNVPVTYKISSDGQDLSFQNVVSVLPYNSHNLEVTFCPLKTFSGVATLQAKCDELGTFPYSLHLLANPPKSEDLVDFECPLGQTMMRTLCINNIFSTSLTFQSKFDCPEFYIEKLPVVVEKQVIGTFDVTFEPSELGEVSSKCTLYAQQAGEFIYPLIGTSTLPKPQGPFLIKPGTTIGINFKNPFNDAKMFLYSVEPENFIIKVTSEVIKSKKPTRINVTMLPLKTPLNDFTMITGILKVVCGESHLSDIKWIYYLQSDL